MEWIILGIFLVSVAEIVKSNPNIYIKRYSNGVTIITNRKTGQKWMQVKGSTNLVPIDKEENLE